jgi:hypothetical protein
MEKNFFSTITKIAENLELKYYWVVFLKYIKPIFFISFYLLFYSFDFSKS